MNSCDKIWKSNEGEYSQASQIGVNNNLPIVLSLAKRRICLKSRASKILQVTIKQT